MNEKDQKQMTDIFLDTVSENAELVKQLQIAKNLQDSLIDDLSVVKVIKVSFRKGLGTKENPVRIVESYWDIDGKFIFTLDQTSN